MPENLKIAYQSAFPPFRGGIAQFNANLMEALARRAEVRAYNFSLQYPSLLFPGTSQYMEGKDHNSPGPARILNSLNPLSYWTAAQQIRRFAPDLLLLGYWMPYFAPSQGTLARLVRRRGTKSIAIVNNMVPHEHRPGDRLLSQYFVHSNDGFVVMGEAVRQDLLSLRPDAPNLLHPHPVYAHFGQPIEQKKAKEKLGIPPERQVVLFFGLIRPYKGLDLLIEAFHQLPENVHLLIAGEAYEPFERYEKLLENGKNATRATVLPRYISDEEVATLFSAADVCALPYRTATQSGVAAIAMHFDLPVLVTDTGNLKETIEPYGTGVVVAAPQATLLADALPSMLQPAQNKTHRQNIRQFKNRYTWDSLAEAIVGFYGEL